MATTITRKYRIVPERVGRHSDVKPFSVVINDGIDSEDAQRIAEGLHNHVKDRLLSKDFSVEVDLARGRFTIQGGRFGKGQITFTEATETEAPDGDVRGEH